jgi:hypothetical protein
MAAKSLVGDYVTVLGTHRILATAMRICRHREHQPGQERGGHLIDEPQRYRGIMWSSVSDESAGQGREAEFRHPQLLQKAHFPSRA